VKLLKLFQSEEDLVKACQKGNPKAQRRIYEKYSPKMLGICFRYVRDEAIAEEIMIEGFVKVFEKIETFKLEGSFEGWIRRIMINESLMYIRSNKKLQIEASYDQILYEPEPVQFRTDLETQDLLKLIERLPLGYRTIFNLYAIEGYSHAEIAKKLSITESTSKSQLSRARVILQNAVMEMA
jgi:RNA polymerase sigma-70 factor (ECF subfamily)